LARYYSATGSTIAAAPLAWFAAPYQIIAESIRRINRGEPPLYKVDRKRGY
jgi:hypothetical protein